MTTSEIRALVLNRNHDVLDGSMLVAPDLQTLREKLRSEGFDVSSPIGVAPPVFVLMEKSADAGGAENSSRWKPRTEVVSSNEEIWGHYCRLVLGGWVPPTRRFDVFAFGAGEFMPAQLGHLVVRGQKRVTATWVASARAAGLTMPYVGMISIVVDGFGFPICAIETTEVLLIPFSEVTAEMAAAEGEGDLSLEDWQRGHLRFWGEHEARLVGRPFTENEIVCIERFRLVQKL